MRRWARTTLVAAGCLLGLVILHLLLVVFPQPLLRHRATRENFTLYSRQALPPETFRVIDRTRELLAASPLDDPELHHPIYLLNSYRLMRFLLIRNVHFGAALVTGGIYITDADVVRDVARCKKLGPGDTRQRTLSGAIAHEVTHQLIRRRVGFRAERRLPVWVKEGYCDFIAHENAIDPVTGFAILDGESVGRVPGYAYFEYRLVLAYLLSERGMAIEEILERPPDFLTVRDDAVAWSREHRTQLLEGWTEE